MHDAMEMTYLFCSSSGGGVEMSVCISSVEMASKRAEARKGEGNWLFPRIPAEDSRFLWNLSFSHLYSWLPTSKRSQLCGPPKGDSVKNFCFNVQLEAFIALQSETVPCVVTLGSGSWNLPRFQNR